MPPQKYSVDRPVDARGQYQYELAPDFPLTIQRLQFFASEPNRPLTWHTYLEVFVCLADWSRIQMGSQLLRLARGDVLVMDHLKLHALVDFPGAEAQAIVIRFQADLIRSNGSTAADHLLLLPFYCQSEDRPHILRAEESTAAGAHDALRQLLTAHARSASSPYWQTGSRAWFLVLLHELAQRFQAAERLKELYARQKTKTGRLNRVFEHIAQHYAEPIALPAMAAKAGLSQPQFYAVFKKAAGTTLVDYVTQVRLAHAARLLVESDKSIAEIASAVGFADQSYFDRRFRRHFGETPRRYREASNRAD
ncbi:MAG TPA: AraC family transcriptional regulator [Opitutaceae bacterium]|nr:AraC family transcriptional regulator [Opitutaceae bacterium]